MVLSECFRHRGLLLTCCSQFCGVTSVRQGTTPSDFLLEQFAEKLAENFIQGQICVTDWDTAPKVRSIAYASAFSSTERLVHSGPRLEEANAHPRSRNDCRRGGFICCICSQRGAGVVRFIWVHSWFVCRSRYKQNLDSVASVESPRTRYPRRILLHYLQQQHRVLPRRPVKFPGYCPRVQRLTLF